MAILFVVLLAPLEAVKLGRVYSKCGKKLLFVYLDICIAYDTALLATND